MRGRRIAGVGVSLALALGSYLATGFVAVGPDQVGVVRRLGRVLERPYGPGLHWGGPWGIDRVDRVRTGEVRRLDVGLTGAAGPDDEPGAGEYLTGDLNLIRVRAVVQYRVADPVAYVLRGGDVGRLLPPIAEASLSRALARRGIDSALGAGRVEVARDTASDLDGAAETLGMGLRVLSVQLVEARPPSEVQPDFAATQAARSARDRRLTEARTYEATALRSGRAEASARLEGAQAATTRRVTLARARAERFIALLDEARSARELTMARLYAQTLRELLPRVRRKLVAPGEPADLTILGGATDR